MDDEREYQKFLEEKAEFDKIARDCNLQGHNYEHYYGCPPVCRNCGIRG